MNLLVEHIELINDSGNGVLSLIYGEARLKSINEIEIKREGGTEIVSADYIIIATGSRPRKLPHIPIDEEIILTSDGIESLTKFPESLVVLGAGVIGCEFTTIFSGFGTTKVNLIDKSHRILPFEDLDIVRVIEEVMEQKGVHIHRNSELTRMDIVDGRVEYELELNDGTTKIFNVEKALISVGRIPNYENLGLEELGIEIDGRGIKDSETQTSIDNIYAVGDITSDIALVNVGELEGRYAVERIFGKPERKLVYENISTIMFLDPEVAGVGLNEIQAQQKGIDYKVASVGYEIVSRAVANRDTRGFIKLLVTNDDKMKLLGMRVVGLGSATTIQAVALLISMRKGINELAECVHPHPSITEGVQECVRLLLGKSLFKSRFYKSHLTCKKFVDGVYTDIDFD
jgi:dihydrolipoamide dehydrogenase